MNLSDLECFEKITIQAHDNPDADAIGAGFGLFLFFKEKGKDVRFFYSGKNEIQKSNLKIMLEKLNIPIEYIEKPTKIEGLLLTVDCQYGAGNVTKFPADEVAIIDHHQVEITDVKLQRIQANLGSCCTLVWTMLREAGYDCTENVELGTALYYGLYMDTSQLSEIFNPFDKDLRDGVKFNRSIFRLLNNSNISLEELEIAGVAMVRTIHNDDYNYALVKAQPCDPNILGLISDFLLQVDRVSTCIVYFENEAGLKFSVRSCIKEVNANELAAYVAQDIGSGGGHVQKAGGFIPKKSYQSKYHKKQSEAYFSDRMVSYFVNSEIIYAKEYNVDISAMKKYKKIPRPIGYVIADEVFPDGTSIRVRTLEGDMNLTVEPDLIIMIGIKGEVYPSRRDKFERSYKILEEPYDIKKCTVNLDYIPNIVNVETEESIVITEFAHTCINTGEVYIHAKKLDKTVKVFTEWDEERYMLGETGDYMVVRSDDNHDIYIVEKDIFDISYAVYEGEI